MKKLPFHIALLFLCVSPIIAQDSLLFSNQTDDFPDSMLIVEKIFINGNDHTKGFVIEREMSLKPGSTITRQMLEYDKQRIYSLGLFNRVEMRVVPSTPPQAMLFVELSERWFLFPYPIFGIRDRDWDRVYYGIGLLHNNFRGRNEKLAFSMIFGYDPSLAVYYRNPFLNDEGSSFFESRIAFNKVHNKSLQGWIGSAGFSEKHFSVSVTVGKRFNIEHTLWATVSYEIVDISDVLPVRTLSPDGKDKFPIVGVGYSYDTRDLVEYPGHGSMFRATITKFGIPSEDVDVVRYALDCRKYIPIVSNFVLTGRIFTDVAAAGKTPSYNRVYFGYSERIRGHFNEVIEGDRQIGTSAELHYPLFGPRYFKVDFLPREFGLWKFGIFAAVFADAGTVWFRGHPLAINNFKKGYGAGLHFLLPYGTIIRTEYAWNEIRHAEFILGFGTTF
jgi:outer membrane protein assembly factor BamA